MSVIWVCIQLFLVKLEYQGAHLIKHEGKAHFLTYFFSVFLSIYQML